MAECCDVEEEDDSSFSSEEVEGAVSAAAISATIPYGSTTTSATATALLISASDKAGMEGIDRERINAIMLRESGNSSFMQRQIKMDKNTNRKIQDMKQTLEEKNNSANEGWREEMIQSTIDPLLSNCRSKRRPTSTCVVIDMDGEYCSVVYSRITISNAIPTDYYICPEGFFISCHILDHPHLANIPACVGGTSMISTSNYVARKYGVRAAMPGYLGSTLVKELSEGKETLTFVKSDFRLYKRKSAEVREVLEEYDPNLNMYSLDEAYMDLGPYLEILMDGDGTDQLSHEEIQKHIQHRNSSKAGQKQSANKQQLHENHAISSIHAASKALLNSIRQKVKLVTGLTCSAGLASNFLLAKIASDIKKPNGQYFVGPSEQNILDFIQPLSIRKVSGIGRVTEKILKGISGIENVKSLYEKRAEVYLLFSLKSASFLMRACIGYADTRRESTDDESGDTDDTLNRKGISHERTFSPTTSWSDMCTRLEGIALSLVEDLRERSLRPKTVTLKVKLSNFDILSRATSRDVPLLFEECNNNRKNSAQDLVDIVIKLLKEAKREHSTAKKNKIATPTTTPFSVRLLGVRCSNFQLGKDNQSSLDKYRVDDTNEPPSVSQATTIDHTASQENSTNNSLMTSNPYICSSKQNSFPQHSSPKPDCIKTPAGNLDVQSQCPVCGLVFDNHDNTEINSHIDSCLNATTVKQLAKAETNCADEKIRKKKKQKVTDFFGQH